MPSDSLLSSFSSFWQAADGQSRLVCGDSFEVLSLLPEGCVDCVWTDPPYFLSNDGFTLSAGRPASVNKGAWDKSQGQAGDYEFHRRWLKECYRVLTPTGTIWVSGTLHSYFHVGRAMQEAGFRLLNDIVWQKPAPPPNLSRRFFTHATELVLWATKARKGKERYTFNYHLMRTENGGKQMRNVWRFAPPSGQEKRFGKHPTQKPVALIERCLRASTSPGALILDPFAGCASTGVAALFTGRRFLCIEKEPSFAMIGARRLDVSSLEQGIHMENKGALHPDLLIKRCPWCLEEDNVIRSGTNHGRSVRYRCKRCRRYFTLAPKQRGYADTLKLRALLLSRKGKGVRAIGRRLGVHHQTVSNWLAAYQASVPALRQ